MAEQTTIAVWEAAGKTLEELRSAGHRFELAHEEDPTDARPLVRQLRFPNLTQAVALAALFDPGAHADVWLMEPVTHLFDVPVTLMVVFHQVRRPAVVHGEDDMRDVIGQVRGTPVGDTPRGALVVHPLGDIV